MEKRIPKSKAELVDEVRQNQKIRQQKNIIRAIMSLPIAQDMSISDFNNHATVVAGLILQALKAKTNEMKVNELNIDLDVKDAPNPGLIQAIYSIVKDEKAPDDVSALLSKLSDHVSFQIKEVAFIERKINEVDVESMIK